MELLHTKEKMSDFKNKYVITHFHKDLELIKINKGKMETLINGKTYELNEGDICLINQNQLHKIYCNDDNKCEFSSLFIDPSLLTNNEEIYSNFVYPILINDEFTHLISKKEETFNKEVSALLSAIKECETNKIQGYELILVAYLHMLFQKFYSKIKENSIKKEKVSYSDLIIYHKIVDYIYQNYDKKITLDNLSQVVNINKNKCCALFKKYAETTPIDFINYYRLEKACKLLKESEESISNIALDTGFNEQSYFNRLFLKRYKITPKEFRERKDI